GHRDLGARSSGSAGNPLAIRSAPAQAIIAALSVHKLSGGAMKRNPAFDARFSRVVLIALLAATPPATTSAGFDSVPKRCANRSSAIEIRSSRLAVTDVW